ncbi:Hsp20/alpha crystallin family protein [bacterium]|nr:Hsp20/alpha crystallin family protein [bacterium]RQV94392.1 MAG: Hsp20/alpha crystallin family protein [bacterium]
MLFDDDMIRWNPWRELPRIQREMNRLFENAWSPQVIPFPPVNIYTNKDEAMVTAELPGMEQKDIHISILNNTITIEGNRVPEDLKEGEALHRQERNYGSFKRSFELPFPANTDKVEANLKNGALIVRLPRAEEDKPKQIEISGSGK